ncbi:HTH-type transcriptional regulator LutR [subsurface metagenome]
MFEKIQNEKVYLKIAKQIFKLIKNDKLKSREKLPSERTLCKEFGASRSSVREAIVALEVEGIIDCKRGKGNFVKSNINLNSNKRFFEEIAEEEGPFDLLEARRIIEPEIALLAIKKATKKDINSLKEILDKMGKSINDFPKTVILGIDFHIRIAKATQNETIFKIFSFITKELQDKIWLNFRKKSWETSGYSKKSYQEHISIFNAIKNKEEDVIRKIVVEHLDNLEKEFIKDQ